jgi:hypothetical protein
MNGRASLAKLPSSLATVDGNEDGHSIVLHATAMLRNQFVLYTHDAPTYLLDVWVSSVDFSLFLCQLVTHCMVCDPDKMAPAVWLVLERKLTEVLFVIVPSGIQPPRLELRRTVARSTSEKWQ